MKRLLVLLAALLILTNSLKSQGDLDEQQRVFLRNEKSFGIQLNSDGLGFGYRVANRTNNLNKNILEFELGTIKHPKEYKFTSYYNGSTFVFGKKNFPMYLRASIGRQRELYEKADLGGVSIRFLYSVGPTLAVYKPIYYEMVYFMPDLSAVIVKEKFHSGIAIPEEIYKKASFFKGFDEIGVIPGVFAKTGITFEYSKQDKIIHAIEVGANVNAYLKEIPIMATNNNRAVFLSLFVSYRFGIVVDPLNPESGKIKNLFRNR
jgi:hypothetical protein